MRKGFKTNLNIGFLMCLVLIFSLSNNATSSPHSEFKLTIISGTQGQSHFIITQALAEIINQDHPWLKASNRVSLGFSDNLKFLSRNQEMRKNTMIVSDDSAIWLISLGEDPFKGFKYTNWRIVSALSHTGVCLIARDPKIKIWRDLKGKRVNVGQVESTLWQYVKLVGEIGWGKEIFENIKKEHMMAKAGKEAFIDRLIDVTIMAMSSAGPNWVISPHMNEILAAFPVYGVDWGKDAIEAVNKKFGLPILRYVEVPPNAYKLSNKEPHYAVLATLSWIADESMPEEVVYEVVKKIYENIDRFKDYHFVGKFMNREMITDMPLEEKYWHPGALKFFKEKGLKIKK